MTNIVWVVGHWIEGNQDWEVIGVSSSEDIAVSWCLDDRYFIGPIPIDTPTHEEGARWEGCYYPLGLIND